MNITKCATAGTLESSDAYVEIEPSENGITVEVASVVEKQFGAAIKTAVLAVLAEQGVTNAHLRIHDRGALDCVIRARVETAIARAKEAVL